jgi:SAM-dependent methyltransferase
MSSSANKTFDRPGVADYERRRYRGLDQRLVDFREKHILRRILRGLIKKGGPAWEREGAALILDAPCGYGRFSGLLLGAGVRLVSSDLAFPMVERAVENSERRRHLGGVEADFRRGLPFKPGVFDYVFSMRLFHHLHAGEDREAVLREFARVAKEGVILSFYGVKGLHALQRKLRRFFRRTQRTIKMVPGATFEKEAASAGFRVERVVPLFRGIHAQHIVVLKKGAGIKIADRT